MQKPLRLVLYRGAYYATWIEDGKQRRASLRTKSRADADEALKAFAEQFEIQNRPNRITVEYVWNAYRETLAGRPSFHTMGFEGRNLIPRLGALDASQLSEEDCRRYISSRIGEGRKAGTVRRELAGLRAASVWAESKGLIDKAPTIPLPPVSPVRDLWLSRNQARDLLAACDLPHVKLFIVLALTTSARMSAILGLTWDRVDFVNGTIDLRDPEVRKSNKGRAITPMNQSARAALEEAQRGALTPFVIEWAGKPVKSVKKGIAAAGRRCGLPWVTPHVFRHTSISWQMQDGVSEFEAAKMAGLSSPSMVRRRYAHLSPDYLKKSADSLELNGGKDV